MLSSGGMSRDFQDLVKNIGESKSKQEEDRIITKEMAVLKQAFQQKDIAGKKMKELVIRLLYVEMLGHDASFGFIQAVNITQERGLHEKRTGYLASSLLLHSEHELLILLVNTIQRDLRSANHFEVCAALSAATTLISKETIPAILPQVTQLLTHTNDGVRKKAVMVLHRFAKVSPDSVEDMTDAFKRALCDRDPSVMSASLCILHDLIKIDNAQYKPLVPSFVSILKQIIDHRLPRDFDYHRIPGPWIQIKLLKILALLGNADQHSSQEMYEVLTDVMKRADISTNIGYAVIFECVKTVTVIYPEKRLLEVAAESISRFITSENPNLKYIGIDALSAIVQVNPKYAAEHQIVVIDCLEDPDETLKRKTLDLLFKMTNPANVVVIVEKMSAFLLATSDNFLRRDLVNKITQLAERYAPDNSWFISTMNNVFTQGGQLVRPDVMHNLLRLIAEGTEEDERADEEMRAFAVGTYLSIVQQATIPEVLLQVAVWVLGEYAYLVSSTPLDETVERLCTLVNKKYKDKNTQCWIMSAIGKLTAQMGRVIDDVRDAAIKYTRSKNQDLQQICHELLALSGNLPLLNSVLPIDASCEDIEVNPSLPFLDSIVQRALASGLPRYTPPEDLDGVDDYAASLAGATHATGTKLRFDAYPLQAAEAAPSLSLADLGIASHPAPTAATSSIYGLDQPHAVGHLESSVEEAVPQPLSLGLALGGGAKKWTADGYAGTKDAAPAPTNYNTAPDLPKSIFSTFAGAPGDPRTTAYSVAAQEQADARAKALGSSPSSYSSAYGAPLKPVVSEAKQQMAASLFAGLSTGGSAAPAKPHAAPAPRPAPQPKPVPAPRPAAAPASDLLFDLGFGPTPAPTPAPSHAATKQAPQHDLLDLLGDLSMSAPAPAPATASAPTLSHGSIYDMLSAPAPAPALSIYSVPLQPVAPAPAAAPTSIFGLAPAQGVGQSFGGESAPMARPTQSQTPKHAMSAFDELLNPSASSSSSVASSWTPPTQIKLPPAFEQQLSGPNQFRSSDSLQPLSADVSLSVSSFTLFRLSETVVVFALFNVGAAALANVVLMFDNPPNLRPSYLVSEPAATVGDKVTVANIGSRQCCYVAIRFSLASLPAPGAKMTVVGKAAYAEPGSRDNRSLGFSLDLSVSDLIRPAPISTADFGAKWGVTLNEKKTRPIAGFASPADWHAAMQTHLHLHPIQIIGTEAIAAGRVVGTDFVILAHGRLNAGNAETTIRSVDPNIAALIVAKLQS